MKILAFDTSTRFLSIALLDDDVVISEFHKDVGIQHNKMLIPTMKNMLDDTGWHIPDIDLICVGTGPGSFTGLRIAIAAAKGMGIVLNNKIKGVPTMDAMVRNVDEKVEYAAPLLDARKGKIYTCIYKNSQQGFVKQTGYLLLAIDELMSELKNKVLFFGDAVSVYKDKLDASSFSEYNENIDWYPRAVEIGRIGLKRSLVSGGDDIRDLTPLYLHAKECNVISR
ncbi:MAG: tRNA (adenosine(37)-N6)-threonylcarbamoyltransferase complex dimerization subunit type 1 TsaB [Candidatus Omnitrophota bacterium]